MSNLQTTFLQYCKSEFFVILKIRAKIHKSFFVELQILQKIAIDKKFFVSFSDHGSPKHLHTNETRDLSKFMIIIKKFQKSSTKEHHDKFFQAVTFVDVAFFLKPIRQLIARLKNFQYQTFWEACSYPWRRIHILNFLIWQRFLQNSKGKNFSNPKIFLPGWK